MQYRVKNVNNSYEVGFLDYSSNWVVVERLASPDEAVMTDKSLQSKYEHKHVVASPHVSEIWEYYNRAIRVQESQWLVLSGILDHLRVIREVLEKQDKERRQKSEGESADGKRQNAD